MPKTEIEGEAKTYIGASRMLPVTVLSFTSSALLYSYRFLRSDTPSSNLHPSSSFSQLNPLAQFQTSSNTNITQQHKPSTGLTHYILVPRRNECRARRRQWLGLTQSYASIVSIQVLALLNVLQVAVSGLRGNDHSWDTVRFVRVHYCTTDGSGGTEHVSHEPCKFAANCHLVAICLGTLGAGAAELTEVWMVRSA